MSLPILSNPSSPLAENYENLKFVRRKDLETSIRITIAIMAIYIMQNKIKGTITRLANEHNVSRTFVYMLASKLQEAAQFLFTESLPPDSGLLLRKKAIEAILSFRMEGQCSLGAISTLMKRFGFFLSSTGSISQILSHAGGLLPMTMSTVGVTIQYIVFASDEIFSKSTPILVTVDPISSAILRIELATSRKADDWKNHFECIVDNGFEPVLMVSDDGQGLRAGLKEAISDVVRQSDTYHAIAHQLGVWLEHFEESVYKAITQEEACEQKLDSAKSEGVQEKRWEAYIQAVDNTKKAIEIYESFSYLYYCIIGELNVFDSTGALRDREHSEMEIKAGLALLKELNHSKITLAANKIKRALPDLFHYFDIAKKVIHECRQLPISEACLNAYCLAWQWDKALRKAKKADRKKRAKAQRQHYLDIAERLHSKDLTDIQKEIFSNLDRIVQSSAMVECINSIIRPYLNTSKNHVTQGQLNLIMHYHNHRRYREGVRKNKTPMELLTGKEQTEDWITIISKTIREKDPEFMLAG